ncbi:MAG: Hint domain-containing protein [Planctomycetes bacterium]|nr:Hint domain-containing protein [Planctomycetota bacterium]
MKHLTGLLVLSTFLTFRCPPVGAASPHDAKDGETRIRQVLQSETQRGATSVDRRQELQADIKRDSSVSSLWWQAGFVKVGEQWMPVEESVPSSALLDEYRAQRALAPKTPAGQMHLANWCRSQKLPEQERAHLSQVLVLSGMDLDPSAVCQRMGYRQVGNRWASLSEIQEMQRLSRKKQDQLRVWQPRVERIARNWNANPKQHKQAQEELGAIKDPAAIPALVDLALANPSLCESICRHLKTINTFAASQGLATIAIVAETPHLRRIAIECLEGRRLDEFVPMLLNGMRTFYQSATANADAPTPRLVFREESDRYVTYDVRLIPTFIQVVIVRSTVQWRNSITASDRTTIARGIDDIDHELQLRMDQDNDVTEKYNTRVVSLLSQLTGQAECQDPRYWWAWWNVYTGTVPPPKRYEVCKSAVALPPITMYQFVHSCLVAGTPVQTDRGQVAIEQIQVGDRVLAKNVNTGEMAYKPVLHTTVREPVTVHRLVVGGQPIVASAGHNFWVSGQGWTRTHELKAGQPLHTATGMVRLESNEIEAKRASVYNLIVADFHSYFIGPSLIFSHDVLQPELTNAKVPGLDMD